MSDLVFVGNEADQTCRVCGCTWSKACPGGCHWVEPDLCSACAIPERARMRFDALDAALMIAGTLLAETSKTIGPGFYSQRLEWPAVSERLPIPLRGSLPPSVPPPPKKGTKRQRRRAAQKAAKLARKIMRQTR